MIDLNETLQKLEISQGEIAAAVGISRQHMYDLRHRRAEPGARVVGQILSFLNRPEHLRKLGRRKPLTFEEVFAATKARQTGRAA